MESPKIMKNMSTLLVANRGEIAVRIMKTAKQLGIRTVAVYSDADADAPHVELADDAVHIGASAVGESYLRVDKILDAARLTGADAIHPGYGFLSENAAFANAVEEAGIIFVGPSAHAIEVMGDKAASKRAMIAAGVPCVPGYQGEDQNQQRLSREALAVGLPVMVKAAAGGGGRGMRLVDSEQDLDAAIQTARSEAENAFGSGELIIEKAVGQARHVEIQVFADSHGNVIHLGERDCSVQRRHQKVVEESPCPVMTEKLRTAMGKAAVEAAKAVSYRGAGTVEFLLDASGEFYFLEMNTRLQVEHPVTEMVTGLDLVALQLSVAEGGSLGLSQQDVQLSGHAIEVRLYAEDPGNDFLPSTGPVHFWQQPEGEGLRVDAAVKSGGQVSPFYDPMIAKVIAFGENRQQARKRLLAALQQTVVFGVRTNRDFLISLLEHSVFAEGMADTGFIGEHYQDGYRQSELSSQTFAVAAVVQYLLRQKQAQHEALAIHPELYEWSSNGDLQTPFYYEIEGELCVFQVRPLGENSYTVNVGEDQLSLKLKSISPTQAVFEINSCGISVTYYAENENTLHLAATGAPILTAVNLIGASDQGDEAGAAGVIVAPMHGSLVDIFVAKGDQVKAGDRLAVLEAMKMQHEICAAADGMVIKVAAAPGDQLAAEDLILELEVLV